MAIDFLEVLQKRHDWAMKHKESGGGVIGCYSGFVPEEIMWACGVLPVQLLMHRGKYVQAEEHLPSYVCDCAKSMLEQKLNGTYKYLDGILVAHVCETIKALAGIWSFLWEDAFVHLFTPPMNKDPGSRIYLKAELLKLAERLGHLGAKPLTDENLRQAIATYNINRRLIRQIYEIRGASPTVIHPEQVLSAVLTGMMMPKPLHNQMLQEFLKTMDVQSSKVDPGGARMIVAGLNFENEVTDGSVLFPVLEALNASVVWDDLASGMRYRLVEVEESTDRSPLDVLVESLMGTPIPLRRSAELKVKELLEAARKYRAQGVIFLAPKYCDPIAFDVPHLTTRLMENGFPSLVLEVSSAVSEGPIRIRVEAFLEMVTDGFDKRLWDKGSIGFL